MRTFVFASSIIATICSCLLVSGCEFSVSGNSSQGENDYFGEPLSNVVKKYESALEASNVFVARFRDNKIDEMYEDLGGSLKEGVSLEEMQETRDGAIEAVGDVIEFLPQQWAFTTGEEDGKGILYSTKIVVHERAELYYILAFADDGKYEKVAGIKIHPRKGNERIMEAVNSILAGGE
jgi:hypothetical protein